MAQVTHISPVCGGAERCSAEWFSGTAEMSMVAQIGPRWFLVVHSGPW